MTNYLFYCPECKEHVVVALPMHGEKNAKCKNGHDMRRVFTVQPVIYRSTGFSTTDKRFNPVAEE